MKKRLFILDGDISYVEHLTDCLNRQKDFPYRAEGFTEESAFIGCLKKRSPQMALVSEKMAEHVEQILLQEQSGDKDSRICIMRLTENEGADGICRYQSGDDLRREILAYVRDDKQVVPERELIGVYSPVHRCGCTIFSIVLSSVLSEQKQTLYVNLEDYHGLSGFADIQTQNDLSDLLYCSRLNGPAGISDILRRSIVKWDELSVLKPAAMSADLWEIQYEEWEELFSSLISNGGYELMVLDIGSRIREVVPLLKLCQRIYMPSLNDRISTGKVHQFEQNLLSAGEEELLGKIQKIAVPRLRSDGELTGFPRQLIRGKIGSYVRSLAAEDGLI